MDPLFKADPFLLCRQGIRCTSFFQQKPIEKKLALKYNTKRILSEAIMNRILSILIAALLMLTSFVVVYAEGYSNSIGSFPSIDGFDDLSDAKVMLFDVDSGAMLYQKNACAQAKPGSLTTIMTALLLIENTRDGDWDTPIHALKQTNSSWSERGAQMGLAIGDTPTRRDLLNALLLCGAADAAYVTYELVSGSEAAFVDAMNARAIELSMDNTHFENGFGLGSNSHYSCARDMAYLTIEAMKHDIFAQVVSSQSYTCSSGCRGILLNNSNTALESPDCFGIKSGEDSEKEHCAIIGYIEGDARLSAVVLEAASESSAYSIVERLVSAGFTSYMTECGLRSYSPTNAIFTVTADTVLLSEPGGSPVRNAVSGEKLHICGSTDFNGNVYYCINDSEGYLWADSAALSFNAYVNDIFIENGAELSCEIDTGAQIETNAFISTHHIIESVKLTIAFADGTPVFTDSAAPGIHGTFELGSSGISEHLKSISIQEGVYTCTLDIEASATIPGCESVTINQRNVSILAVSTGGSCISYNANSGQDAPLGECFFGSTIIPQAVPSKTGCVFSGWNTMPDGTGTTYNPGDEVLSDDSLTLYAVWSAGISSWNASVEAAYDSSLRLSGSIENPAGILTIKLAILADGVSTYENVFPCDSNTVDASAFTSKQPIELAPGEYVVELYGMSSDTSEELIFSQNLSVSSSHQTEPVQTAEAIFPQTTQESGESGFSLGSIPIWVWFVLGMAVVAGLICAIVIIIKRG